MNDKKLKIEYVPVDELKPYEGNAKEHPDWQIEQIMLSMKEFGNIDPIGIWRDEIVEGHGRLIAAKELGYEKVPVIRLDQLSDQQRRAYALVHNKLTMNTDFDWSKLEEELKALDSIDMEQFGFDEMQKELDWFEQKAKFGDAGGEEDEEYQAFVDKFKVKKTTDDCFTPQNVYDVIADWVAKEYHLDRKNFLRPFYPNGDYQKEKYRGGASSSTIRRSPSLLRSADGTWIAILNFSFLLRRSRFSLLTILASVMYAQTARSPMRTAHV